MRAAFFVFAVALLTISSSRAAQATNMGIKGFHQITDMATCAAAQGRSANGTYVANSEAICTANSAKGLMFFGWICDLCHTSYDFAQLWRITETNTSATSVGPSIDIQGEFESGPFFYTWTSRPNEVAPAQCIAAMLIGPGAGAGWGEEWLSNAICNAHWIPIGKRQSFALGSSAYGSSSGLGGHKGFAQLPTPSPTPNNSIKRFANSAALAPIPPPAPSQLTILSTASDAAQCVQRTQLGSEKCDGALSNHWVILVWNSTCSACSYGIHEGTGSGETDTGYNPSVPYAILAPPFNAASCYKVQAISTSTGGKSIWVSAGSC